VTFLWKRRNCRYTVAGTVWAFHPTSLVALMGTCDGPTRCLMTANWIANCCCKELCCLGRRKLYALATLLSSRDTEALVNFNSLTPKAFANFSPAVGAKRQPWGKCSPEFVEP